MALGDRFRHQRHIHRVVGMTTRLAVLETWSRWRRHNTLHRIAPVLPTIRISCADVRSPRCPERRWFDVGGASAECSRLAMHFVKTGTAWRRCCCRRRRDRRPVRRGTSGRSSRRLAGRELAQPDRGSRLQELRSSRDQAGCRRGRVARCPGLCPRQISTRRVRRTPCPSQPRSRRSLWNRPKRVVGQSGATIVDDR